MKKSIQELQQELESLYDQLNEKTAKCKELNEKMVERIRYAYYGDIEEIGDELVEITKQIRAISDRIDEIVDDVAEMAEKA